MAEDNSLEENLGVVLQWLLSTNRVAIAGEGEGTRPPAGKNAQDATASDPAALSRRFLKEWHGEGCPGKPPVTGKRPLAPERTAAVATHSLYSRTPVGDAASSTSTASTAVGADEQAVEAGDAAAKSPVASAAKKPRKASAAESTGAPGVELLDLDACDFQGCNSPARFGFVTATLPTHCLRHKAKGMMERAKRRKACDSCTTRKIRCDGAKPSCGPCSSRGAPCRYSTRLKSGPKRPSMDGCGRRTTPTEIAPAPLSIFGGSPPGSGNHSVAAAAAAAVAALSPFSINASTAGTPSLLPTPVTTTTATSVGSGGGAGVGDAFMGGTSGLEVSPRALAAHALTGFRYTKDAPSAAGGVVAGPSIWPALGALNASGTVAGGAAMVAAGQERRAGEGATNGAAGAPAVGGGDLAGLASLSLAQLTSANPGLQLAMLGLLPGYGSMLGNLPAGIQRQQQQQLQQLQQALEAAAVMQGVGASPAAPVSQAQSVGQQQQGVPPRQQPVQPQPALRSAPLSPSVSIGGIPKPQADQQQQPPAQLQIRPAAIATPTANSPIAPASTVGPLSAHNGGHPPHPPPPPTALTAPPTPPAGGPLAVPLTPSVPSSSSSPMVPGEQDTAAVAAAASAISQAELMPQQSTPSPGAQQQTTDASMVATDAPPVQVEVPKSPQGLNLLLISQELQKAVGSARSMSAMGAGPVAMPVAEAGIGDVGNVSPGIARFRTPTTAKPASKLRRSCDRCTMRKIRCDGNGEICKRCEMDGQSCHYSVKAKSGPKPQQVRVSPVSPMTVGGLMGEVRPPQAAPPQATLAPANADEIERGRSLALDRIMQHTYRMHGLPAPSAVALPGPRTSWGPPSTPPPPPLQQPLPLLAPLNVPTTPPPHPRTPPPNVPVTTPPPASRPPSPVKLPSTLPAAESAVMEGATLEGLRRERMAVLGGVPGVPEQDASVRTFASQETLPPGGADVMAGRVDVLRDNVGVAGVEPGLGDAAGVAPSSEAFAATGGGAEEVGEESVVPPTSTPPIPSQDATARGGMEESSEVVSMARSKEIII